MRDYFQHLQLDKAAQQQTDRRVFMLTSLAVGVVYVAVYAKYDMSLADGSGGVNSSSWTAWVLESARYVLCFSLFSLILADSDICVLFR